jgi:dihydrofolate synthase/folylpolyglutamate synthase
VALVTTIAIDHVDWLGHTEEAIGREKAGIFRRGVPAVIGDSQVPVSLLQSAQEKQALALQMGRDFEYQKQINCWDWSSNQVKLLQLPIPQLQGEHQFRNASAVLMAVNCLQPQLPVTELAIRNGLSQTRLQGRFQLIEGENPILLDVGHNPQAVQTLLDFLQTHFADVKIHAVFAMMKDKDIPKVLSMMHKRVSAWYLAPLKNPRAAPEALLSQYFQELDIPLVNRGYQNFAEAFNAARRQVLPGEMILIFGSFFLVSEYLSQFA